MFEAGQIAHDNLTRSCQAGKFLAHDRKWHACLLGNLQVEPLTVLLQALQDFEHHHASGKEIV